MILISPDSPKSEKESGSACVHRERPEFGGVAVGSGHDEPICRLKDIMTNYKTDVADQTAGCERGGVGSRFTTFGALLGFTFAPRPARLAASRCDPHALPQGTASKQASALPAWKRGLDLLGLLLALPVVLCLGLFVALFVKLTSSGPVFFRQERVGHLGRRFTCLKFRSMRTNADASTHQAYAQQLMCSDAPMTKLDSVGDSRLIPGGGWLRASGLDELPQLLNVLRGEMSLVGPRPCVPYEYDRYESGQKARFAAVPGLTGLWQVSGKNKTTFNQMIEMDIWYANHVSLGMDLEIIARTIPAILKMVVERFIGTWCTEAGPVAVEALPEMQT